MVEDNLKGLLDISSLPLNMDLNLDMDHLLEDTMTVEVAAIPIEGITEDVRGVWRHRIIHQVNLHYFVTLAMTLLLDSLRLYDSVFIM
jgi:hypothetical protein